MSTSIWTSISSFSARSAGPLVFEDHRQCYRANLVVLDDEEALALILVFALIRFGPFVVAAAFALRMAGIGLLVSLFRVIHVAICPLSWCGRRVECTHSTVDMRGRGNASAGRMAGAPPPSICLQMTIIFCEDYIDVFRQTENEEEAAPKPPVVVGEPLLASSKRRPVPRPSPGQYRQLNDITRWGAAVARWRTNRGRRGGGRCRVFQLGRGRESGSVPQSASALRAIDARAAVDQCAAVVAGACTGGSGSIRSRTRSGAARLPSRTSF